MPNARGIPIEAAPTFVFLASDESDYVSGQILGPTAGRRPEERSPSRETLARCSCILRQHRSAVEPTAGSSVIAQGTRFMCCITGAESLVISAIIAAVSAVCTFV